MDERHPKRKKDQQNPYTLSIENGTYYISFTDGQGNAQKLVVDAELYELFDGFELEDISHMNIVSRHWEQLELTEAALQRRAIDQPESIENFVAKRIKYQKLHTAIAQLPELQRRRVLLYYFGGYTYEQIAEMEGCTKRAIKFSVDIALENLKNFL